MSQITSVLAKYTVKTSNVGRFKVLKKNYPFPVFTSCWCSYLAQGWVLLAFHEPSDISSLRVSSSHFLWAYSSKKGWGTVSSLCIRRKQRVPQISHHLKFRCVLLHLLPGVCCMQWNPKMIWPSGRVSNDQSKGLLWLLQHDCLQCCFTGVFWWWIGPKIHKNK